MVQDRRLIDMQKEEELLKRYLHVRETIARTAEAESVLAPTFLIASKAIPAEDILPLLRAGHRVFGENRVQEAEEKWATLREQFPDIVLHLIGPLQSRKVKMAVASFDVIQTVDRQKIAIALKKEMTRTEKRLRLFLQVNTGEEPQKAGILPRETASFTAWCLEHYALRFTGLMCIPPIDENPSLHFALLRKLAQENNLSELSMGMSADYERAIPYGSTCVRIGSAVFDERKIRKEQP